MTASLGSLTVSLGLQAGEYFAGLTKAQYEAKKFVDSFKKIAEVVGVGLSINAFKDFIQGSIEAADHLNNLSKQTGIALTSLGGIGFAATRAGGNLDTASAAAGKLNKQLAEASAGNATASEAFKALGINVKDAAGNTTTADVALTQIATKFASYADGPEKAALALRLFGKAGADMIPLLDDGGQKLQENIDYYKRYASVNKETAEAATEFNNTLAKMKLLTAGFGTQLASELLKPLQAIGDELVRSKEEGGAYTTFIAGTRIAFETLTVVGSDVAFVFTQIGKAVIAYGEASVKIAHLDFSGA